MDISSSQRIRYESGARPVMPADIFLAAIKGNSDELMALLQVPIEASDFAFEQIETRDDQTIQFWPIESATDFGDTLLHILITKGHNELALKVFERDMSLLLAQNNMLETPLHCAAKVGNEEVICNLIESNRVAVLNALEKINKNGETALQIAAKYGHMNAVRRLMMSFDLKVSSKMRNESLSLLHIAIVEGYTSFVEIMLEIEPTLAYAQFPDGMFPIHVVASRGNKHLIGHFMQKYPDCVRLLDPHGRNLFHIAAKENREDLFGDIFKGDNFREMMNNATDYKGNTPLHIAAMNGHRSIMRAIWENKMNDFAETVKNHEGLTPFQLSARRLEVVENIDFTKIRKYTDIEGHKFTLKWFEEVMKPSPAPWFEKIWETAQFFGLGSVLITTVTFAAAFTIPGGYNQDHGTPVLGRKYAFRAFIIANSLAFIQGFLSLITIIRYSIFSGQLGRGLNFATFLMGYAANCMVVAFGLGLYVTLAPVCLPIAILLLVISLFFGSPANLILINRVQKYFLKLTVTRRTWCGVAFYAVCCVFIFCLALL